MRVNKLELVFSFTSTERRTNIRRQIVPCWVLMERFRSLTFVFMCQIRSPINRLIKSFGIILLLWHTNKPPGGFLPVCDVGKCWKELGGKYHLKLHIPALKRVVPGSLGPIAQPLLTTPQAEIIYHHQEVQLFWQHVGYWFCGKYVPGLPVRFWI